MSHRLFVVALLTPSLAYSQPKTVSPNGNSSGVVSVPSASAMSALGGPAGAAALGIADTSIGAGSAFGLWSGAAYLQAAPLAMSAPQSAIDLSAIEIGPGFATRAAAISPVEQAARRESSPLQQTPSQRAVPLTLNTPEGAAITGNGAIELAGELVERAAKADGAAGKDEALREGFDRERMRGFSPRAFVAALKWRTSYAAASTAKLLRSRRKTSAEESRLETPAPPKADAPAPSRRHIWNGLITAAALAMLGVMIVQIGPATIFAQLAHVGWWLPLAAIPFAFVTIFDGVAWRHTIPHAARVVGIPFLILARAAANAFGFALPGYLMQNEAKRISLLQSRGASFSDSAASVLVSRASEIMAHLIFVAASFATALAFLPTTAIGIPGVGSAVGFLVLLFGGLVVWLKYGFFKPLELLARRSPALSRSLSTRLVEFRKTDAVVRDYLNASSRDFWKATAGHLAGWGFIVAEAALFMWLLGLPINVPVAALVGALLTVVEVAMFVLPGGIGALEGLSVVILGALGVAEPTALAFGLLRRLREVFFIVLGFAIYFALARVPVSTKTAPTTSERSR